MSRRTKSWMVATIMTMLVTMLSFMGNASTASAAGGDPIIPLTPSCTVTLVSGDAATAPLAPTCYDPSGSDQDELLVPSEAESGVSYVDANMNPYWYDRPNSTKGASQVPVQSMYYDPVVGGFVEGHKWVLGFNTGLTAASTANSYWVVLGDCKSPSGIPVREATAFVKNEVGQDGRFIRSVYPEASADGGGIDVLDTVPAARLYDGATVGVPLISIEEQKPGLDPGYTYQVKFWLADVGSADDSSSSTRWLGATRSVYVPECGPTTTPAPSARPKATITVLHRGRVYNQVKVMLGSQQATRATYRVIRDPRRGRTIRRTYTTTYKVLRYDRVRKGTVITITFNGEVVRRRI